MALSTTRTVVTQTGINTHQVLNVGGLDSAGIATFLNFFKIFIMRKESI